jgi:hypothetical protein
VAILFRERLAHPQGRRGRAMWDITRCQNGRVWSENALGAGGPEGAGTVLAKLSLFIVTIVVGLAAGALSVHWFGL